MLQTFTEQASTVFSSIASHFTDVCSYLSTDAKLTAGLLTLAALGTTAYCFFKPKEPVSKAETPGTTTTEIATSAGTEQQSGEAVQSKKPRSQQTPRPSARIRDETTAPDAKKTFSIFACVQNDTGRLGARCHSTGLSDSEHVKLCNAVFKTWHTLPDMDDKESKFTAALITEHATTLSAFPADTLIDLHMFERGGNRSACKAWRAIGGQKQRRAMSGRIEKAKAARRALDLSQSSSSQ